MEASASYQFLELNMDVNGTPSVAPINSGASCFLDKSLVKTAHLTIFWGNNLNDPCKWIFISTGVCLVPIDFGKRL